MLISSLSGPSSLTRSFSSVVRLAKGYINNDFTEFGGGCSLWRQISAKMHLRDKTCSQAYILFHTRSYYLRARKFYLRARAHSERFSSSEEIESERVNRGLKSISSLPASRSSHSARSKVIFWAFWGREPRQGGLSCDWPFPRSDI